MKSPRILHSSPLSLYFARVKNWLTLPLLFAVLFQSSIKSGIVAYYELNKEYIATTLCENRAKPKMQCNGKCYLSKKIQAQEKQDQELPSLLKGIEEVTLFYQNIQISFCKTVYIFQQAASTFYLLKKYASPLDCIFQPPQ